MRAEITNERPGPDTLASRVALRFLSLLALILFVAVGFAARACAAEPEWHLGVLAPDGVAENELVKVTSLLVNRGQVPLSGEITLTNTFPTGIEPVEPFDVISGNNVGGSCQIVGAADVCHLNVDGLVPGGEVRVIWQARVEGASEGDLLRDTIEATGGGAAGGQTIEHLMTVGASEPFAIRDFGMEIVDAENALVSQAGSAPAELVNSLVLKSIGTSFGGFGFVGLTVPAEPLRNVVAHVPVGLVGNPNATGDRCPLARLAEASPQSAAQKIPNCPASSQVGTLRLGASATGEGADIVPLYNLVPPPGVPAALGFNFNAFTTILTAKLRPSDYGIDIISRTPPTTLPITAAYLTLWGVPADASHDHLRHLCMDHFEGNWQGQSCPSEDKPEPFLRMPTACSGGPLPWSVEVDSYAHPGTEVTAATTTDPVTGCQRLPFDPLLALRPTDASPRASSGLDATLTMPQEFAPTGLAEADLRSASVTLPEGMTINPASATGLGACTDSQLRLGLEGPSECPDASKIGSLELETPLLDHPLLGSVFLRSQGSGTPDSGDLYRLALEIRSDDDGIAIKLPGSIKADPRTGRLTTAFGDLPQLPFEAMHLHLKSGPRAPLITPGCGTQTAAAELTGWNGKVVDTTAAFDISGGDCRQGFDPRFTAGSEDPAAGVSTPFHFRLTREDSSQELSGLRLTLPQGVLGNLKGIPYCSGSALAAVSSAPGTGRGQETAPSCPSASQVGTVTVGAGAGTNPFYTSAGRAYLAGPYKGAPLSLAVIAPAVAGPFDLGSVVVRNALWVDPVTTQVSIESDPLPTILQGIPLDLRDVRVDVNRDHFTQNPTSCEPARVQGSFTSVSGQRATGSQRFQITNCAALAFKPRLALQLHGPTHRAAHPSLRAVLRARPGEANIGKASVLLPRTELLENAHIRTVCTRVQYNAGGGGGAGCPAGSVYGYAKAWSPLLDQPLQGPVYLRSNGGERLLPDLVASLGGQIHIDLVGYIDAVKARIRNRFATVPDAPVSKFELTMQGGRKGLLANNVNLCRAKPRARASFEGQNGKVHDINPLVKVDCGGGKRGRHGR